MDELERFEEKLKAKRAAAAAVSTGREVVTTHDEQSIDELDEYLQRLKMNENKQPQEPLQQTQQPHPNEDDLRKVIATAGAVQIDDIASPPDCQTNVPLPVLLYFALGLLFFVSTVTNELPSSSPTTATTTTTTTVPTACKHRPRINR